MLVEKDGVGLGETPMLFERAADCLGVHLQAYGHPIRALELLDRIVFLKAIDRLAEYGLPSIAAHLPVGKDGKSDVALHLERLDDTAILDLAQLVAGNSAGLKCIARVEQLGGANETADLVGTVGHVY